MKYLFIICAVSIGCSGSEIINSLEPESDIEESCWSIIADDEPSVCEDVCFHMLTTCTIDSNGYSDAPKGYAKCVEMCEFRSDMICEGPNCAGLPPIIQQRECILAAGNATECEDCNYWGE